MLLIRTQRRAHNSFQIFLFVYFSVRTQKESLDSCLGSGTKALKSSWKRTYISLNNVSFGIIFIFYLKKNFNHMHALFSSVQAIHWLEPLSESGLKYLVVVV